MKKLSIYILTILAFTVACVRVNVYPKAAEGVSPATIKKSVHQVVCQEVNTGLVIGWGSGVTVRHYAGEPIMILTAWHVVEGCSRNGGMLLVLVGGKYRLLRLIDKAGDRVDLALVKTSEIFNIKQSSLPVSSSQGREGDKVYTAGFPCCSGLYMLETGTLANLSGFSILDEKEYILLSSSVTSGSSGGPALNENYEIIGINVQVEQDFLGGITFHAFSVPLRDIKRFLRKNNVKY